MMVLSKVWAFIKHYWYVPVALVGAIISYLVLRDKHALSGWASLLDSVDESHRRELKQIEQIQADRAAADAAATRRMLEAQEQLRIELARKQMELDAKQLKRAQQITKQLKDDPQGMAAALEKEFGVRVIVVD